MSRADAPVIEEKDAACCYAKSDKQWINDPQGIAWETFLTHGQFKIYGAERPGVAVKEATNYCKPKPAAAGGCCAA